MNCRKTIYVIHTGKVIANAHTNEVEAYASLKRVQKAGIDTSKFRITKISLYEYSEASESSLHLLSEGNVSDSRIINETSPDLSEVQQLDSNRDRIMGYPNPHDPQLELLEHYVEKKRDALQNALNLKKEGE